MRLLSTKEKRFRLHMEHERQKGYLLDEAPNGQWFVSGPSPLDIKEMHGAVLNLYDRRKGCVSQAKIVHNNAEQTLLIGDIESEIENKGYGSILMNNIINIAVMLEADSITGKLAETDSDHFDKLKYFYEKYGFIVKISDPSKTGTIYRKMM